MPTWYGSHPFHHLGQKGTIVIPEEILAGYIQYMLAGFWNTGFRKIIIVNGHGQDYVIPLAIHKFGKKWQVPAIILYVHFWNAAKEQMGTKEVGGPYEKWFVHADEIEQSWCKALFPEFIQEDKEISVPAAPMLPPGHIMDSSEMNGGVIKWYNAMGSCGAECICQPEGVIGDATKADWTKAKKGVEMTLDYLEKLVNDILERYPAGVLPPIDKLTQRPKEDIEAVIKGPNEPGGRHLYTLEY